MFGPASLPLAPLHESSWYMPCSLERPTRSTVVFTLYGTDNTTVTSAVCPGETHVLQVGRCF